MWSPLQKVTHYGKCFPKCSFCSTSPDLSSKQFRMSVSRQEFQTFMRKYDEDRREFKELLQQLLAKQIPSNSAVASATMSCVFHRFVGVIPNPNSGRTSKQSSFINVATALKRGISTYNDSVSDQDPKIETTELDGSLLSWSHSVYSTVGNIIGRYSGLNSALGNASLDEAKKLQYFATRPSRYNREVSGVMTEIKKIVPILNLAHGDWAAREVLRNKFQNARNATKRNEKAVKKVHLTNDHLSTGKPLTHESLKTKIPASGTRRDRLTSKLNINRRKTQNKIVDNSSSEEDENTASSSSLSPVSKGSKRRKQNTSSSRLVGVKRKRSSKHNVKEIGHVARNVVKRESKRRLKNILRTTADRKSTKRHYVCSDDSDTESELEIAKNYSEEEKL